jgi:hypothetical protein
MYEIQSYTAHFLVTAVFTLTGLRGKEGKEFQVVLCNFFLTVLDVRLLPMQILQSRLKHISSSYCCRCNVTDINRAQEVMSETCRRWTTSTSLPPWAPQTPDAPNCRLCSTSAIQRKWHLNRTNGNIIRVLVYMATTEFWRVNWLNAAVNDCPLPYSCWRSKLFRSLTELEEFWTAVSAEVLYRFLRPVRNSQSLNANIYPRASSYLANIIYAAVKLVHQFWSTYSWSLNNYSRWIKKYKIVRDYS